MTMRCSLYCILVLLVTLSASVAAESLPQGAKLTRLEVFPTEVSLDGKFAYRQLIVTAKLQSGDTVDVTRLVKASVAGAVTAVSKSGVVTALEDGDATIELELAGLRFSVPVKITGTGREVRPSFVQDIMPLMARIGCNGGTCHGSQKGKNGFKMSLRGFDPLFDHRALVDDLEGRRFNRAAPDRSLFLMKISGAVPHVGGVHTLPGEPYYETFRAWVSQGAKLDLDSPRVEKIEIYPNDRVLPLPGMRQQMSVLATFSDGKVRDVTSEAFIETSNTDVTGVDGSIVTTLRRGEAAILARYEGRYAATQIFVMGDRSGWKWTAPSELNYIDTLVYKKLAKVKSLPSELCTDEEFIRRVYLDLVGIPPTSHETRTFLMDRREGSAKRNELVDRLVGSAEFVDFWTNKWSDLLQVNKKWLGSQGASALRDWVRVAIASNMPYNEFVHAVMDSSGSTLKNPPTSYYKVLRSPEAVMENTTQLFLGVRFSCNKCHDHPFERWTQSDYWELAAYFAQVERKNAPGSKKLPNAGFANTGANEELISDKKGGDVKFPNGLVASPAFPYLHDGKVAADKTRRSAMASWLTAPENPYFARSFVNRLWSYFLGVGFIEPVDDIRAGNPPTNPALLERLTVDFIESGFNVRGLMRLVCKSRVYQHSIETNKWNEDDDINFSHGLTRRLSAETLFDAIHRASGSVTKLPGQRPGTRAVSIPGPDVKLPDGFLDLFGRPPRESACECERTSGMSLGQALNLVNGPTFANAINDPQNGIVSLLALEQKAGKIVDELYLSFLCRLPTSQERAGLAKMFDTRDAANIAGLTSTERKDFQQRFEGWEKGQHIARWTTLKPTIARSAGGAVLAGQEDGSILASGAAPDTDTYVVIAWTDVEKITGVRVEVLPHDSLGKAKGPGRSDNGNFVLSELSVTAIPAGKPAMAKPVKLQNATQTFAQKDLAANGSINDKTDDKKGWAIAKGTGRRQRAVFETKEDVGGPGGTLLVFTVDQHYGSKHTLGRFKIEVTSSQRPVRTLPLPENIAQIVLTPKDKRTPEQLSAILGHYLGTDKDVGKRIRLGAAQDIAWALANSPAFLFNR